MEHKYAILTGAGFTHNFGAPLGSEMWSIIYNSKELEEYPKIKRIMKRLEFDYNYEKLFFEICQNRIICDREIKKAVCWGGKEAFKKAVYGAYDIVDDIVRNSIYQSNGAFELTILQDALIKPLVSKGYFFTLNQDLFVERNFRNRTYCLVLPGVINNSEVFNNSVEPMEGHFLTIPSQKQKIDWGQNSAYYIKLHGSCNWVREEGGGRLMVLGGNKKQIIEKDWLIKEYFRIFEKVIEEDITNLVIIGYGFMDHHVNNVLLAGCKRKNFKMHLISPDSPRDTAERMFRYYKIKSSEKHKKPDIELSNVWKLFLNIHYHYPVSLTTMLGEGKKTIFERLWDDLSLSNYFTH